MLRWLLRLLKRLLRRLLLDAEQIGLVRAVPLRVDAHLLEHAALARREPDVVVWTGLLGPCRCRQHGNQKDRKALHCVPLASCILSIIKFSVAQYDLISSSPGSVLRMALTV